MVRVVTLDTISEAADLPSWPSSIAQDSKGRVFVALSWGNAEEAPLVFDATGKFLGRLGRVGDGPGEFRRPSAIIVFHDSVHVLDEGLARLSVYDSSLTLIRTATFPRVQQAVRLPRGFIVKAGGGTAAAAAGFLQVVAADGATLTMFGETTYRPCPTCNASDPRVIAAADQDGVWSAWFGFRYQIDRWDSVGKLVATFTSAPDWFEPYEAHANPGPQTPPQARVIALGQDRPDLLWVLGRTANPDWKRGIGALTTNQEGTRSHIVTGRIYDGVFEAIDPRTGDVLARTRSAIVPSYWLGAGRFASVRLQADGRIVVDIHQLDYRDIAKEVPIPQ